MSEKIFTLNILYCCPIGDCMKEYLTKFNLKKHIEIAHIGKKLFVCEVCCKSLSSKQVLKEHMHIHQGIKSHKCSVCRKKFRHYSHLALHRKKHDFRLVTQNTRN